MSHHCLIMAMPACAMTLSMMAVQGRLSSCMLLYAAGVACQRTMHTSLAT